MSSLRRLDAYLEKVFDWSRQLERLEDGRQAPRVPLAQVFEGVFWGTVLQQQSLHSIEAECREGLLRRRVGPLSESTVGYALERMDLESLRALSIGVARRLKRNAVLHWETAGGQLAMAIDGIELFQSESRCCADCLQRHKQREGQPVVEFHHWVVVASLVGFGFRFVVDLEGLQPGENEVGAGERLLRRMVGELGWRFFQIVTVDALYTVPSFVQAVRELGLELVAPLKANQPDLLEQAQRRLQGPPDTVLEGPGSKRQQIWEEPRLWWDSGRRSVRVLRVVSEREVSERIAGHKQSRTIRSEAFYLSTCPRPRTHAHSIVRLAAARWELETSTFAHLSSEYGLKHAQVHSGKPRAFVAQLMIRLLAAALFMIFVCRQVWSHCRRHKPSLKLIVQRCYWNLAQSPEAWAPG